MNPKILPMQHDVVSVLNQLHIATHNLSHVPLHDIINRRVESRGEEISTYLAFARILEDLVKISHAISDYYKEQQR